MKLRPEYIEYFTKQGRKFGYPDCCIKQFCERWSASKEQIRASAGSGFIPCMEHAKMINDGKIKLVDLIEESKRETFEY